MTGANFGDSNQKYYKLNGTVVNSVTGEAIPHALVQVYNRSALTDASGHFEFADLPEMQTAVAVRKPGFFSEQELSRAYRNSDLARVGPDSDPVTVKLVPESVIYGKVGSQGDPVERIPVTLYQTSIVEGRRSWEQHQTFTDEDGEFRFAELRPGGYLISAGPGLDTSALVIAGPESEFGYAKAFYPNAADFSNAAPTSLASGQQVEIDFSLKKSPAFKLSGTVVGGAPGFGVSLTFNDRPGRSFGVPVRFDPGPQQFEMRVPGGSYVLHAQSQDQSGAQLSADVPITISSDRSGLVIALEPMPSIPVNLHLEPSQGDNSRQPHPGFSSFGSRNGIPANITLETTGDTLDRRNYSPYQDQGKDQDKKSQFSFHNVEAGKYNLIVRAFEPWYVQSATAGGANLLSEELEVRGSGQSIDIVLRNDGASLNISLGTRRKPIPAAILVVRDDAPRDIRTMTVEGDGPFSINGLAPGGYDVLAFDTIEQLEYSDLEVLHPYLSRAAHVSLLPGQSIDVKVERVRRER